MRYLSTRGGTETVEFCEAVAQGLAPDGGLYLPETFPDLSPLVDAWSGLSYPQLCHAFFQHFATDLPDSDLEGAIYSAYAGFSHEETAPLVRLNDQWQVLELFHGPTLAFKDFALQLLGNLYELQIKKTGKKLCVLGATSGDTGAAAISGLLGKSGVEVFILYPEGKVSPLQERQMTCTGADNVYPLAIEGTFDDAQRTVKELFGISLFVIQSGCQRLTRSIWQEFLLNRSIIFTRGSSLSQSSVNTRHLSCPLGTLVMFLPVGCSQEWGLSWEVFV